MISKSLIEDFSVKWRTQELNVAREYAQHVLLSALYGADEDVKLAFKGGTALRLLRQSPRFSEDLDFTGWAKAYHAERFVNLAVKGAALAGLPFKILESNKTSGGWFALVETEIHEWLVRVEWNISLRAGAVPLSETILVGTPLWPPYSVRALPVSVMAAEKIEALFRRKEPRDFFDVYYLLRNRLGVPEISAQKNRLMECAGELNPRIVKNELKQFLPKSQWPLVSGFPEIFKQELGRL